MRMRRRKSTRLRTATSCKGPKARAEPYIYAGVRCRTCARHASIVLLYQSGSVLTGVRAHTQHVRRSGQVNLM